MDIPRSTRPLIREGAATRGTFNPYIHLERRQIGVNRRSGYQTYTGTCYYAQQYAEKMLKE